MGCAGSKLDDLDAVALCRHRTDFLSKAIQQRYALADAHHSYLQSLRSVGLSLHRFFLLTDNLPLPPSSPLLNLPPHRKGDPIAAADRCLSPSHSGSHLQFHSSSDDDDGDDFHHDFDDDDDGPLHSDNSSSPLPHHLDHDEQHDFTTTKTHHNFARKAPPQSSVGFQQRPPDVNPVQVGGFDDNNNNNYLFAAPSGPAYPYSHQSQNYGYGHAYPYPSDYGGGFYGSSPPPQQQQQPAPPSVPPPPPSPPRASTWDFLNPFGTYESYDQTYTPSRSSRELREEEGIPELEDEEQEVVKKAYDDKDHNQKSTLPDASSSADVRSTGKDVAMEEDGRSVGEEMHYQAKPSSAGEGEVHLTEKSVVVEEVLQRRPEEALQVKLVPGSRTVHDAVRAIKSQFDKASTSCEEISKMLEVGKLPYHRRKYEVVSSKVRYAITPSLSTATTLQTGTSKANERSDHPDSTYLDFDEEKGMKSGNLSSTLQKLFIWEKKLLEEVKAEEMMRIRHDKKSKRLQHLDVRGAEHYKIESTRGVVMRLSTKIRIAIQVVDSISKRIDKLRDEELWPQLHELIQGLIRMWQIMSECHRSQCQAVIESGSLDSVASAFAGNLPDVHMDATMHLGLELLKWIEVFSSWIDAQKCYVRSLNGWLMKCLRDEPEETADGIAPFSPGRLGAPPVFVICNHWSQAIDRISEKEVIESMQFFTTNVLQVWKRQYGESRVRMLGNREMERRLKALERDDQKIHKAVEGLNKWHGRVAKQNDTYAGEIIHFDQATEVRSLQRALQEIFEAMERFSEDSLKAYKELGVRCEEEIAKRAKRKASLHVK